MLCRTYYFSIFSSLVFKANNLFAIKLSAVVDLNQLLYSTSLFSGLFVFTGGAGVSQTATASIHTKTLLVEMLVII